MTSIDEIWWRAELAIDASLAELRVLLYLLGTIRVDPGDLGKYAHVDSRAVAGFDSSGHVHPRARGDTKQAIKHS